MPFDGKHVETPAMRRAILVDTLRHPLVNWRWDFSFTSNSLDNPSCGTAGCAMGIAAKMWPQLHFYSPDDSGWRPIMELFGLTQQQARDTFGLSAYETNNRDVTPAMVADRLESIVKEG